MSRNISPEPAGKTGTSQRLILLVEDDQDLREWMSWSLQRDGWQVDAARDGMEALNWLAELRPDLLIVDLALPMHSGEVVVAALRAAYGRLIPVIVVSGEETVEAVAERMQANRYLRKPFPVGGLLDAVREELDPA